MFCRCPEKKYTIGDWRTIFVMNGSFETSDLSPENALEQFNILKQHPGNSTVFIKIIDGKYYTFLYFSPLVFLLHVFNIVLIAWRKHLQTAGNSFLVSLSVTDTLTLILFLIRCPNAEVCQRTRHYLTSPIMWCYIVSLWSTLGITLDKYISVQYSLTYHVIVTKKTVTKAILMVWILSGLLESVLTILSFATEEYMYFDVTNYVVILPCCVILLACSLHIQRVRNRHEMNISRQRRHFGVQKEQLHLLQRIRESVVGVWRLNMATAVVVFVTTILSAIWKYGKLKGDPLVLRMFGLAYVVHLFSNPVHYIVFISNLRNEYRKIIFHSNGVRPLVRYRRSNKEQQDGDSNIICYEHS